MSDEAIANGLKAAIAIMGKAANDLVGQRDALAERVAAFEAEVAALKREFGMMYERSVVVSHDMSLLDIE